MQQTLILVRGLPGSGKSHLANTLAEAIGRDKVVILDPDKIDLKSKEYLDFSENLSKDEVDAKFHPYRWLRAKAHAAIEAGKTVIWNQGFTNLDGFQKTVVNLQSHAKDHNVDLPLLVVEVSVSHDVAKQRVAERAAQGGHDVTAENFARFINDYTSFADQGYPTVAVNGEDDVQKSVQTVLKAL